MENIICKKCGKENDYSTQLKGMHNAATCNNCQSFIKNISYAESKFYVGKYRDVLISECEDLEYIIWFVENTNPKEKVKIACISRIEILKNL
jgi:hypothetical protein